MDIAITKVVFRKFKDGSILALFPEIPHDTLGLYCSSYQHVGQHGAAIYDHCIRLTKPATKEESKDLKTELQFIGYNLIERKRT